MAVSLSAEGSSGAILDPHRFEQPATSIRLIDLLRDGHALPGPIHLSVARAADGGHAAQAELANASLPKRSAVRDLHDVLTVPTGEGLHLEVEPRAALGVVALPASLNRHRAYSMMSESVSTVVRAPPAI